MAEDCGVGAVTLLRTLRDLLDTVLAYKLDYDELTWSLGKALLSSMIL
jgi:hypothetical protein